MQIIYHEQGFHTFLHFYIKTLWITIHLDRQNFWRLICASPETAETPRIHGAELCRKSSDARRWVPVPDTGARCPSHAGHGADSMANAENGWGKQQRHVDSFQSFYIFLQYLPCCSLDITCSLEELLKNFCRLSEHGISLSGRKNWEHSEVRRINSDLICHKSRFTISDPF